MASRGYQDLNFRIAGNSPYDWGGSTYNKFMFNAGESYPSGVITSSSLSNQFPNSPAGTNDIEHTHSFVAIIPTVYDAMSIIDGTVTGTIRFGVSHFGVATEYTRIDSIDLTLNAIDGTGSSRTVASKEIYPGTIQAIDGGGTVILQTKYLIDVEDIFLFSNERLVLSYDYTATTHSIQAGNYGTVYIYATDDTEETSISLPFVM